LSAFVVVAVFALCIVGITQAANVFGAQSIMSMDFSISSMDVIDDDYRIIDSGVSRVLSGDILVSGPGQAEFSQRDTSANFSSQSAMLPIMFVYQDSLRTGGTVPAAHGITPPGNITLAGQGSMVRTNYRFVGWRNGNHIFQAGQSFHYGAGSTGHFHFEAAWERIVNVTLRFEGNGGTPALQTQSRPQGSTISLPSTPTRTGYQFVGWFNTPNQTGGTRIFTGSIVPNVNTTYWARWERQFRIEFVGNGGSPTSNHVGPFYNGATMNFTPLQPTRSGHVFLGWYRTRTPGVNDFPISFPLRVGANDTRFYARWQRVVTVRYVNLVNDASMINLANQIVDQSVRNLFLNNFGVNLVHTGTRTENRLNNVPRSAPSLLGVSHAPWGYSHFRFVNFPIDNGRYLGAALTVLFEAGPVNSRHRGETVISTTSPDFNRTRTVAVHEISHILGAPVNDCPNRDPGCAMRSPIGFTYWNWCNPCRATMRHTIATWTSDGILR